MISAPTRRSGFRRGVILAAAGACLAMATLLTGWGPARGQGGPTFGVRPADESASAYFNYTLEPGARKTDTALVTNNTGAELALKVYAADAITASGGGTAFGGAGERRTGVAAWVSTAQAELNIAAGATVAVPVTITVPQGTAPGDHVAGIVVEAPPKAGAGGNVNTTVTERAGVAIVVRVPGPEKEKLTLGEFCFNQETGSRYFEIAVKNEGTVLSSATGTFKLETENGTQVFERPMELGSVIPTLETVIRAHSPQDPPPGKYVARLTLKQKDGQEIQRDSKIKIPEKKVNGCKTEGAVKGARDGQDKNDNFAVQGVKDIGGGSVLLVLALVAALGVMTAALGFVLWRNRRKGSQDGPGTSA